MLFYCLPLILLSYSIVAPFLLFVLLVGFCLALALAFALLSFAGLQMLTQNATRLRDYTLHDCERGCATARDMIAHLRGYYYYFSSWRRLWFAGIS